MEGNSARTNYYALRCRSIFLVKLFKISNNSLRYIATKIAWTLFLASVSIIKLVFNRERKTDDRGYKELHYKAGSPAPKHVTYKEDIFPLKKVQFEDMMVPIPNNYDSYLRNLYGDYMEIPDNKKTHTKSLINGSK